MVFFTDSEKSKASPLLWRESEYYFCASSSSLSSGNVQMTNRVEKHAVAVCVGGGEEEGEHHNGNTGGHFLLKSKISESRKNTGRSLMIVHVECCSI